MTHTQEEADAELRKKLFYIVWNWFKENRFYSNWRTTDERDKWTADDFQLITPENSAGSLAAEVGLLINTLLKADREAVQAHNAHIGENRYDVSRLGTYVFVGDSDRIKNLEDLYWSYVMEYVARESASYDHHKLEYVKQNMEYAGFDKVGIHKLLARADQYAKERLAQLSPIQPKEQEKP